MIYKETHRILVVDDQQDILEDYLQVLSPVENEKRMDVDLMEQELFGMSRHRKVLLDMPEHHIDITTATQGEEALALVRQAVEQHQPFSLIFMDVRMPPGMDGILVSREIRNIDSDVEIVIVSAYSDYSRPEIMEIVAGKREKDNLYCLRKPFSSHQIREMANALLRKRSLNRKVKEKTAEINKVHSVVILTLASLAELRDDDTGSHLKRVAEYVKIIARELNKLPEYRSYVTPKYLEDIGESSILHDIGKVGIPDAILLKPGKLTEKEFTIMQSHTTIGGEVLSRAVKELAGQSFLTLATEVARYHHEKWDGTGYPEGLKGEEIPLSARIMALADVFDALSSDRPYRKAFSHDNVNRIITEEMGEKHFDPALLGVFLKCQDAFEEVKKRFS